MSNETRIYLNPGAVSVGARIGETMRHAADQQAYVDVLSGELLQRRSSGLGRTALREFELEFSYQKDKLDFRIGEADDIIAASLDVTVVDLESGEPVAEGLLISANYHTGTLTVADASLQEIEYVSNVPTPEGINQRYSGRKLTVGFEVKSVPKINQQIIRLR